MSELIEALEDFEDDLKCAGKNRHAANVYNAVEYIQTLTAKVEALEKENKRIAKRCQAIAQQHYLAKNAAVDIDEKITKEFNL